MKDPLRDNRIFPEEMQQKPVPPKKTTNFSWLWIFIGIILFALLVYFGYQTYLNQQENVSDNPTLQEQRDIFNATRDAQPTMTQRDRELQINSFLYGGEVN